MPIQFTPRNGQWVTFTHAHDQAHRDQDGQAVGIFQAGGTDPTNRNVRLPDRIVLVNPEGENVPLVYRGQTFPAVVALADVQDLAPLTRLEDIPAARRCQFPAGWQPKP